MTDYKELKVWCRAVDSVSKVYGLTSGFPDVERFGITNQMRRAAVSIPSNIAEGSARHHAKDFIHFLRMADGSAAELETQLIISCKLGYLENADEILEEITVLRRMLAALIKSLGK